MEVKSLLGGLNQRRGTIYLPFISAATTNVHRIHRNAGLHKNIDRKSFLITQSPVAIN